MGEGGSSKGIQNNNHELQLLSPPPRSAQGEQKPPLIYLRYNFQNLSSEYSLDLQNARFTVSFGAHLSRY